MPFVLTYERGEVTHFEICSSRFNVKLNQMAILNMCRFSKISSSLHCSSSQKRTHSSQAYVGAFTLEQLSAKKGTTNNNIYTKYTRIRTRAPLVLFCFFLPIRPTRLLMQSYFFGGVIMII